MNNSTNQNTGLDTATAESHKEKYQRKLKTRTKNAGTSRNRKYE